MQNGLGQKGNGVVQIFQELYITLWREVNPLILKVFLKLVELDENKPFFPMAKISCVWLCHITYNWDVNSVSC